MRKISSILMVFVCALMFSDVGYGQSAPIRLIGVDEMGQVCRVDIWPTHYPPDPAYIRVALFSHANGDTGVRPTIDANFLLPITPTETTDGECSAIAGAKADTVIVDGYTVTKRERHVEGLASNWITETSLFFADQDFSTLSAVQIRVGGRALTGGGACSKLRNGQLDAKYICKSLQSASAGFVARAVPSQDCQSKLIEP